MDNNDYERMRKKEEAEEEKTDMIHMAMLHVHLYCFRRAILSLGNCNHK